MNYLPLLLLALTGVVVAKGMNTRKKNGGNVRKPKSIPGSTPAQKMQNLRSQMMTAFADGDMLAYTRLQREMEFLELESGL